MPELENEAGGKLKISGTTTWRGGQGCPEGWIGRGGVNRERFVRLIGNVLHVVDAVL